MNMTINEAHAQAVHHDRIFHVKHQIKGRWYEDRVLDWVEKNGHKKIRTFMANSERVEVDLE